MVRGTPDASAVAAVAEQIMLRRALPPPQMRRAIRQAAGFSAAEVASLMGVTRQAVGKWERGERMPRGDCLKVYVEVLKVLAETTAPVATGA